MVACDNEHTPPSWPRASVTRVPSKEAVDALLEGLNPPPRDAVTHGEGPLLILAGAGSGKTRVLTHRIAWLNHTNRARANEILAITFTNKAAQEMRSRVELLVGRATRAMWVMTFHSACARMLRADAHRLGYTRQFTIYDAADSRRLPGGRREPARSRGCAARRRSLPDPADGEPMLRRSCPPRPTSASNSSSKG